MLSASSIPGLQTEKKKKYDTITRQLTKKKKKRRFWKKLSTEILDETRTREKNVTLALQWSLSRAEPEVEVEVLALDLDWIEVAQSGTRLQTSLWVSSRTRSNFGWNGSFFYRLCREISLLPLICIVIFAKVDKYLQLGATGADNYHSRRQSQSLSNVHL